MEIQVLFLFFVPNIMENGSPLLWIFHTKLWPSVISKTLESMCPSVCPSVHPSIRPLHQLSVIKLYQGWDTREIQLYFMSLSHVKLSNYNHQTNISICLMVQLSFWNVEEWERRVIQKLCSTRVTVTCYFSSYHNVTLMTVIVWTICWTVRTISPLWQCQRSSVICNSHTPTGFHEETTHSFHGAGEEKTELRCAKQNFHSLTLNIMLPFSPLCFQCFYLYNIGGTAPSHIRCYLIKGLFCSALIALIGYIMKSQIVVIA